MKFRLDTARRLALALVLGLAAQAWGQDFPAAGRAIALIVPFPAGGPTDKVARDLAEALRRPLGGASIVIENAPGAGSAAGAARAARARPDGYTLLLSHIGMATAPALQQRPGFRADEFEYLGLVSEVPMALLGRASLPATDYAALRRWLLRHGQEATLGHAGPGSASHLCALLLQQGLRMRLREVTYPGTAAALTDLAAGRIDLLCEQTAHATQALERQAVRAFAVTTQQRLPAPAVYQGLPTLAELGMPQFRLNIWHGLYAPRGMSAAMTRTLNEALQVALRDPDFIRRQQELGAAVVTDERTTPAAHRRFVMEQTRYWQTLLRPQPPEPAPEATARH